MRRLSSWRAIYGSISRWRGRIHFRDGAVNVSAGEMFVVPKGVEHKPYAEHEAKLLLIEPRGSTQYGTRG
jgi:mannose-6-phosphate isomerase-like protein (cupin superfamily)